MLSSVGYAKYDANGAVACWVMFLMPLTSLKGNVASSLCINGLKCRSRKLKPISSALDSKFSVCYYILSD